MELSGTYDGKLNLRAIANIVEEAVGLKLKSYASSDKFYFNDFNSQKAAKYKSISRIAVNVLNLARQFDYTRNLIQDPDDYYDNEQLEELDEACRYYDSLNENIPAISIEIIVNYLLNNQPHVNWTAETARLHFITLLKRIQKDFKVDFKTQLVIHNFHVPELVDARLNIPEEFIGFHNNPSYQCRVAIGI